MARTISAALLTEQNASPRVPYIRIYINSTDYSPRLLYLEHHEEAYRDRAVIGLSNRDGTLDSLNLDGYEFEIGYGYITGNAVAEPNGNNDTAEYEYTPTLWVKSHQVISVRGERVYQIEAEGMWMKMREQQMIAGVNQWRASVAVVVDQRVPPTTPNGHNYKCTTAGTTGATEPTWPTTPGSTVTDGTVVWTEDGIAIQNYSNSFPATHTVEELMQLIIESFGWTWTAVGATNDGIIADFKPVFEVNQMPFESAASLLYRLVWMTKHYFRAKKSKTFEMVFPQAADAADVTYYSDQDPRFDSHVEISKLLIPNSILVLCNQDPNKQWNTDSYPLISGTASDVPTDPAYDEIIQVFLAGNIRIQADADNRASAILTRLKAEQNAGRTVVPHDVQIELYDKISIQDNIT